MLVFLFFLNEVFKNKKSIKVKKIIDMIIWKCILKLRYFRYSVGQGSPQFGKSEKRNKKENIISNFAIHETLCVQENQNKSSILKPCLPFSWNVYNDSRIFCLAPEICFVKRRYWLPWASQNFVNHEGTFD